MLTTKDEELDDVTEKSETMLRRLSSTSPTQKPSALQEKEEKLDLEEKRMEVQDRCREDEYKRLQDRFTTGRRALVIASRLKYAQEENED